MQNGPIHWKKEKEIDLPSTLDTNHWEKFESFASPFLIT